MKKTSLALVSIICFSAVACADVTINLEGGSLFDETVSSAAPDGSLVYAIASPSGSFSGPTSSAFFSGDEIFLGSWNVDSVGVGAPGAFSVALSGIELTGGLASGVAFRMLWFPDLTDMSAISLVGLNFGLYRASEWVLPSDGNIVNIAFETASIGGDIPDELAVADNQVVPEPATYASLLGVAGLAFAACRRRR